MLSIRKKSRCWSTLNVTYFFQYNNHHNHNHLQSVRMEIVHQHQAHRQVVFHPIKMVLYYYNILCHHNFFSLSSKSFSISIKQKQNKKITFCCFLWWYFENQIHLQSLIKASWSRANQPGKFYLWLDTAAAADLFICYFESHFRLVFSSFLIIQIISRVNFLGFNDAVMRFFFSLI